ncbi:hypothetical protein ACFE04_025076 [Oxalis oulophora]
MNWTKGGRWISQIYKRSSGGAGYDKNVIFKMNVYCTTTTTTTTSSTSCCFERNPFGTRYYSSNNGDNDVKFDRNFLAKLWVTDINNNKKIIIKGKRKYQNPVGKQILVDQVVQQPPPTQPLSGLLEPTSPEEVQLAPLLARSNLLITRDIEWANLVLGFEQENRYVIVDVCDPNQARVGFIYEKSNLIARQLFRTRRPFVASISDAMGNELFKVRRPFWWLTSSIYVEVNGKEIGVVHRRWHLWRRLYDLYLGDKQFAEVRNPGLWNWTFTLQDGDGEVLGQIDRDWRGFGFEILTDAGQYVIRFGATKTDYKTGAAALIQELEVVRPLTLTERAITVALAISLDNDYFSRHGGWVETSICAALLILNLCWLSITNAKASSRNLGSPFFPLACL